MNAMVVGADRLGNIPEVLAGFGICVVRHVDGRCTAHQRRAPALPKGIGLLVLFTDFLGHNVMRQFRGMAQDQGIPVIACRRSAACLSESVARCLAAQSGRKCGRCPLGAAEKKEKGRENAC